jgi:hypothetical protein
MPATLDAAAGSASLRVPARSGRVRHRYPTLVEWQVLDSGSDRVGGGHPLGAPIILALAPQPARRGLHRRHRSRA